MIMMTEGKDIGLYISMGEKNKFVDDNKAFFYFQKAFELDPSNPDSLSNYLIYVVMKDKNLNQIIKSKSIILDSIDRCNILIDEKPNMSTVYLKNGLFYLFLNEIQNSFDNYLLGLRLIPEETKIINILKSLNLLKDMENQIRGLDVIKHLLMLYIVFHNNNKEVKKQLRISSEKIKGKFRKPVIVLAGTTSIQLEKEIIEFKDNILEAFKNFKGTIISGGTRSGVSGFAGDLQEKYPKRIKTFGYLPGHRFLIEEAIDSRYTEIVRTKGFEFSFREPISYWKHICLNGITNRDVKLLGIGGGKIASFEYQLALLFSTQVGILEESKRGALNLISDPKWQNLELKNKNLIKILKNDVKDIENFIVKS